MSEFQKFRSSSAWKRARRIVLAEEEFCGICLRPVDKTLPPRLPMSPEVDHRIPLEKGGHPTDRSNLMLTHKLCNQKKGKKVLSEYDRSKLEEAITEERYYGPEEDWSDIFDFWRRQ